MSNIDLFAILGMVLIWLMTLRIAYISGEIKQRREACKLFDKITLAFDKDAKAFVGKHYKEENDSVSQ
jgi:hypothetical protein